MKIKLSSIFVMACYSLSLASTSTKSNAGEFYTESAKPKIIAQDSVMDAEAAINAAERRGFYFDNGSTVFLSKPRGYCGFINPEHLQLFQRINPAPSRGRLIQSKFSKYLGACALPKGYFDNGATVFFSAGTGTFCGFPNPQALGAHKRLDTRFLLPEYNRIDIDPNKFMKYIGVCQ